MINVTILWFLTNKFKLCRTNVFSGENLWLRWGKRNHEVDLIEREKMHVDVWRRPETVSGSGKYSKCTYYVHLLRKTRQHIRELQPSLIHLLVPICCALINVMKFSKGLINLIALVLFIQWTCEFVVHLQSVACWLRAKSKVVGLYGNRPISPNIRGQMKEIVNNMLLRGITGGVWTVHYTDV